MRITTSDVHWRTTQLPSDEEDIDPEVIRPQKQCDSERPRGERQCRGDEQAEQDVRTPQPEQGDGNIPGSGGQGMIVQERQHQCQQYVGEPQAAESRERPPG